MVFSSVGRSSLIQPFNIANVEHSDRVAIDPASCNVDHSRSWSWSLSSRTDWGSVEHRNGYDNCIIFEESLECDEVYSARRSVVLHPPASTGKMPVMVWEILLDSSRHEFIFFFQRLTFGTRDIDQNTLNALRTSLPDLCSLLLRRWFTADS